MALTDNIVAYYKLDESSGNAADSVGSRTLTNTGTATYVTALIANGVDYGTSNTTKYLAYTTDNYGINGTASSCFGWMKLNAEIGSGGDCEVMYLGTSTAKVGLLVRYQYNGGTRRLYFDRLREGVIDQSFTYNITLGTSSYYHIGWSYDGSTLTGYVNGSSVGSVSASGNGSSASPDGFYLGNNTGVLKASAIFDEWGIWSRALSSTEVSQLYNSGAGLTYPFSTPNSNFLAFMY